MVFDLTNLQSYDSLSKWHKVLSETVEVPLIIVGNKVDLGGCCIDEERV